MVKERSSKQPSLHWPGWIWVIGHFIWGGFILTPVILQLVIYPMMDSSLYQRLLESGEWLPIVFLFTYASLCISSAIVLLRNRKSGYVLAVVTLSISSALFVFLIVWMFVSPGPKRGGPLMWGVWGTVINILWWIYFILARRRYVSSEAGGSQPTADS